MKKYLLTEDDVIKIINDYEEYIWDEESFNGKDRLSLKEWVGKYFKSCEK